MPKPHAIVTGLLITYPVGGVAWDYLQYAMALEALGYEVHYLEDTGWLAYDPTVGDETNTGQYGMQLLRQTLESILPSMRDRWSYRDANGHLHGPDADRMPDLVGSADLFLNVSGGTLLRPEYARCPRKVLIDTDPGLNHFQSWPKWDAEPGWQGTLGWRGHDLHFTYAQRIGRPGCVLPTFGIDWHTTLPPVMLDRWQPRPPGERWSTVMSWRTIAKPIEYQSVAYGGKEMEFPLIEQVPQRVSTRCEVASGGTAPLQRWRDLGWSIADGYEQTRTVDAYRHYVEQSRAELSIAKNIYVAARSGWFSCRSVCYLAAARPVVVQDTGFSEQLPCGEGLLAFQTADEAVAAIERVEADYAGHAAAARQVAADVFDGRKVVGDILQKAGLA